MLLSVDTTFRSMPKRYRNILIVIFVLTLGRLIHDPMVTPAPAAQEEILCHPTTATAEQTVEKTFEKPSLVRGDWVGSIFQTDPSTIDGGSAAATTQPTEEA